MVAAPMRKGSFEIGKAEAIARFYGATRHPEAQFAEREGY
jgi:hypothetical protein